MKFVLFCHSLISDWNHGNAHFLRGLCAELRSRGHGVAVYEPEDAWSLRNLVRSEGPSCLARIRRDLRRHYPDLDPVRYEPGGPDLERALGGADVVLVHEWNEPDLVRRIGEHRRRGGSYRLFFHDTHHRSMTEPETIDRFELDGFDGVLAFGEPVRDIYQRRGWGRRVWTWREAADVRLFRPLERRQRGDLAWIGNWGDAERSVELRRFVLRPTSELGLAAVIHGVRYPDEALRAVDEAGGEYRGWLPNYRVPEVLARYRASVHVPRRPYLEELRPVPTIRPFEVMACGVPMVSARWDDPAGLFRAGEDFLVARDAREMREHLSALVHDDELRAAVGRRARRTILERHTCSHRVDELMRILAELEPGAAPDCSSRASGASAGERNRRLGDESELAGTGERA